MGIRTRIEPVESFVKLVIDEDLSPAGQAKAIEAFALERIDSARKTNEAALGRTIDYEVFVNGRRGAALGTVRPRGGEILIEFELMLDVLNWIITTLRDRSPVESGLYRDSHKLFVDREEVDLGGDLPVGEEYVFMNTTPYARRLEVGKTDSGRDFLISVPNRIYARTAADAARRFGNVADIRSTFERTTAPYRLKRDQASRRFLPNGRVYVSPKQRDDRVAGSAVNVPAIVVTDRRK